MPSRLSAIRSFSYSKNIRGDHQYIASAEHYLGEALLAQHKYREQRSCCSRRWTLETHWRAIWRSARSANALGEALHGQGRTDEAEQYLVDSYRDLNADPGADDDSKRIARERITKFYTALGQRQKLNTLLPQKGGGDSTPADRATRPPASATGG